jgi:hypothetical protein
MRLFTRLRATYVKGFALLSDAFALTEKCGQKAGFFGVDGQEILPYVRGRGRSQYVTHTPRRGRRA